MFLIAIKKTPMVVLAAVTVTDGVVALLGILCCFVKSASRQLLMMFFSHGVKDSNCQIRRIPVTWWHSRILITSCDLTGLVVSCAPMMNASLPLRVLP